MARRWLARSVQVLHGKCVRTELLADMRKRDRLAKIKEMSCDDRIKIYNVRSDRMKNLFSINV